MWLKPLVKQRTLLPSAYCLFRHCSNATEARNWLQTFPGGAVHLRKDDESGFAYLRLSHPARRNALTGAMMVQLADAVYDLEAWNEGRGLLLMGDNKQFCSGGDLTFMNQIANPKDGVRMSSFMQDVTGRLASLPLVSVAMLEGHTLGGGAELAMACDYRFIAEDAKIGFVQSRMGISPGWGGATLLRLRVDFSTALLALTCGETYDAQTAVKIGLADDVFSTPVEEDGSRDMALETVGFEWLSSRLARHRTATRVLKRIVWNSLTASSIVDSLNAEREAFGSVWGGPDHMDVLRRIFNKEKS